MYGRGFQTITEFQSLQICKREEKKEGILVNLQTSPVVSVDETLGLVLGHSEFLGPVSDKGRLAAPHTHVPPLTVPFLPTKGGRLLSDSKGPSTPLGGQTGDV